MAEVQLLNVAQMAAHLAIGKLGVYDLVKEGMPCIKVGPRRAFRFELTEVMKWVEEHKKHGGEDDSEGEGQALQRHQGAGDGHIDPQGQGVHPQHA